MSWGRLPRPNPCLPCMVANPKNAHSWSVYEIHANGARLRVEAPDMTAAKQYARAQMGLPARADVSAIHIGPAKGSSRLDNPRRRKDAGDVHIHVDTSGAHAAYGRGSRTRADNPKLMVVNPSTGLQGAIEAKLKRRLTGKEKTLLATACREFKTFHGREPRVDDIVPVDVPPGTPVVVMGIGRVERQNYVVPMESERRGKWTHKAGDHGRKFETKAPWFAAIPGRKSHNVVIAQPPGAKTYFKPTHGLMG